MVNCPTYSILKSGDCKKTKQISVQKICSQNPVRIYQYAMHSLTMAALLSERLIEVGPKQPKIQEPRKPWMNESMNDFGKCVLFTNGFKNVPYNQS